MLKSDRVLRIISIFLALALSVLVNASCKPFPTIHKTTTAVTASAMPKNFLTPKKSEEESTPRPLPASPDSNLPDESDTDPFPTPPPDPGQTPIHPFYDSAGNPPTAPGLALRHRVFNREPAKIAYITIDDGPYPETTPRILKVLNDEGIKATFFVIGSQVQSYPELLKEEYVQGNAIGNHTYSHDYSLIYRSPKDFLADVKKNEDLIYKIIGIRPHILRAPGGTQGFFDVNYYNAVDAADYLVYDWNCVTGDATAPLVPTEQLVRNVETQVPGKNRVILLMHDIGTKTTSVEALPRIIEYLKKEGYAFGVLTPHVIPIVFAGCFKSK